MKHLERLRVVLTTFFCLIGFIFVFVEPISLSQAIKQVLIILTCLIVTIIGINIKIPAVIINGIKIYRIKGDEEDGE